ncbi:MAG: hypothetical protein LUH22_01785 [Bacteroides sp.]|nr:hypothetical protein [Bacteroides sp.]
MKRSISIILLFLNCVLIFPCVYVEFQDDITDANKRVNTRFINQYQVKYLLNNLWVYKNSYIREKGTRSDLETDLNHKIKINFRDSAIFLHGEKIGSFNLVYFDHLDSIKFYEGLRYNIDRYVLSMKFNENNPIAQGECRIIALSDRLLNMEYQRVNEISSKKEYVNVIFHAEGKEKMLKENREDTVLREWF